MNWFIFTGLMLGIALGGAMLREDMGLIIQIVGTIMGCIGLFKVLIRTQTKEEK